MSRLVVISNRLPNLRSKASAGGLAVALGAALKAYDGLWLGWSGQTGGRSEEATIQPGDGFTLAMIDLSKHDRDGYYKNYANRTLWPLFHNRIRLCDFDNNSYTVYRDVNRYFAGHVKNCLKSDDMIWVQDYHLIPLAFELRRLGVTVPVGFFLHIPFPPLEAMLALPDHRELVNMLLSYDMIGMQTERDLRNLQDYVEQELRGRINGQGQIIVAGTKSRVGVYPIGIDTKAFALLPLSKAGQVQSAKVLTSRDGFSWIIGVDRLDYTKGLYRKFRAYQTLLHDHSEFHGDVQLVQVAAPSREDLPDYVDARAELDAIVGEINGQYGLFDWTPLKYVNKAYSQTHIAALYRQSRVGLVTPLRDGMNLVAKEYVAAQDPSDPGVLVLSQFAGAAEELTGALIVNPYDIGDTARAINEALRMPLKERRARWQRMYNYLVEHDVYRWCDTFIDDLECSCATVETQVA